MTAPFPLPDTIDIWRNDETIIDFPNVPARVVPCFKGVMQQLDTATNTRAAFIDHWVDFDDVGYIVDGASRIAAVFQSFEHDFGPIITMQFGGWLLKLRIVWFELRFTNTERYYVRAWCSRMSQGEA